MDLHLPPVPVAALAVAAGAASRDIRDVVVSDVAADSRTVRPGSLFFCVPGATSDGHTFAAEALDAGAAALVVERWVPVRAPQVLVPSVRAAMGPMSALVFGEPARDLTMIGVTGTNGKTTTTFLLDAILRHAGQRSAVIGTTGVIVDGIVTPPILTTPEAPDLHRTLAGLRAGGVRAVAMEVSSHALTFDRVGGIVFDVAAFTNLGHDHLDLHGSIDAYYEAKASLFTPARSRRGVVNADDAHGRRLAREASIPITTFGVSEGVDLRATDVAVGPAGSSFVIGGRGISMKLLGEPNVSNAVCALAVADRLEIAPDLAAEGLTLAPVVPGRLEPIDEGQGFLVMVDYAHTPDSILLVLRGARALATGRTIVVFGCGGDRDQAKRPLMGRAATDEADLTIITTDNARDESPSDIIDAIVAGAREGAGAWQVEPDRRVAIRSALAVARPGDVVVIAGKGHESVQEIAGRRVPFDDRVVTREELLRLGGAA